MESTGRLSSPFSGHFCFLTNFYVQHGTKWNTILNDHLKIAMEQFHPNVTLSWALLLFNLTTFDPVTERLKTFLFVHNFQELKCLDTWSMDFKIQGYCHGAITSPTHDWLHVGPS